MVEDGKITDMRMPAECLDGYIGSQTTDDLVKRSKCRGRYSRPDWIMTDDKKQINGLGVLNSIQEPTFLHKICCFDDFADIRVSSEVVEYTEGHDAQAVGCGEIAEFVPNVLELPSLAVQDLDIACEIPFPIDLGKLTEGFVCNIGQVKLMVACPISTSKYKICGGVANRLSANHIQHSRKLHY